MHLSKFCLTIIPTIGLALTSCIQQNTKSGQPASLTAADGASGCNIDLSNIEKINQDCVDEILGKLPFAELLQALPPSNSLIQKLIKDRVTGYWPQWLLDDIKKEGKEKAGERLVRYYYTFLKLPSFFKNPDSRSAIMVRTNMPNNKLTWKTASQIGDHAVAYYENEDRALTLYDLQTQQVVDRVLIPGGPGNGAFAKIHDLGQNKFVVMRGNGLYPDLFYNPLQGFIWTWNKNGLQLLETINVPVGKTMWELLGSSDQGFVTWTYSDRPTADRPTTGGPRVVDLWNTEGLVKSVPVPAGFVLEPSDYYGNNHIDCMKRNNWAGYKEAFLKSLEYLKGQGIKVDFDHLSHHYKSYFGQKIDQRTIITAGSDGLTLRSLDYRKHRQLFGHKEVRHSNIYFINKNGDFIFWGDQVINDLNYVNLWKTVQRAVAYSERTPKPE